TENELDPLEEEGGTDAGDSQDLAVFVVRPSGRRGSEVLCLHLQELENHDRRSLQQSRTGDSPAAARISDDRSVRAGRSAVHRAQRRTDVHLQRGGLAAGQLRYAAGGGLLLGQALERGGPQ